MAEATTWLSVAGAAVSGAVTVWTLALRARSKEKLAAISRGSAQAAQIVAGEVAAYGIEARNMTASDQYQLATKQISARSQRLLVLAITFLVALVVLAITAVVIVTNNGRTASADAMPVDKQSNSSGGSAQGSGAERGSATAAGSTSAAPNVGAGSNAGSGVIAGSGSNAGSGQGEKKHSGASAPVSKTKIRPPEPPPPASCRFECVGTYPGSGLNLLESRKYVLTVVVNKTGGADSFTIHNNNGPNLINVTAGDQDAVVSGPGRLTICSTVPGTGGGCATNCAETKRGARLFTDQYSVELQVECR